MPRGGKRTGTPGASYQNRTDLNQPVQTGPSSVYGEATQQAAAQSAIPLPATSPPPSPSDVPYLSDPSGRPGEPVTAGLPMGAGAGPEALGNLGGPSDDALMDFKRAYQLFPNDQLRKVIEHLEREIGIV